MASLVKPSPECRRRAGRNGGLVFLIPLRKPSEGRSPSPGPTGHERGESDQGKGPVGEPDKDNSPVDCCPGERPSQGRLGPVPKRSRECAAAGIVPLNGLAMGEPETCQGPGGALARRTGRPRRVCPGLPSAAGKRSAGRRAAGLQARARTAKRSKACVRVKDGGKPEKGGGPVNPRPGEIVDRSRKT